jgi:hypothetical protein
MTAEINALRGPLLSSTSHAHFKKVNQHPVYIKDALIILDGDKIIDFGHRKNYRTSFLMMLQ